MVQFVAHQGPREVQLLLRTLVGQSVLTHLCAVGEDLVPDLGDAGLVECRARDHPRSGFATAHQPQRSGQIAGGRF